MSTKKSRLILVSALAALVVQVPVSMADTTSGMSVLAEDVRQQVNTGNMQQVNTGNMQQQVNVPSPTDLEIKPGECWVYGQIKPKAVEKTVAVTVKDSHTTINVTPAEIHRGYKKVVTREGTVTYRLQPATYKRVTDRVLVRPETTRFVKIPAVYDWRDKRVVVEEARTVVEQCRSPGGAVAFCAKEIPAREEVVKVQVLVQPEQTKVEMVPAKYETVTKWVVDKPARVIEVSLAPKLEDVPVDEVVKPASAQPRQVPAQKRQIQLKSYQGKPRMVMRRAVCNDRLTPKLIIALQQRLSVSGYRLGKVDGMLGQRTMDALGAFQADTGLAVGAITYESLDALGITDF